MNETNPDAVRPTKKQRELLGFIESFIKEHGYSPSYREIMSGLGYTSVATVALHVGNLIKRGHLRKRDRSARSLEVVGTDLGLGSKAGTILEHEAKWLVEQVHALMVELENAAKPSPQET
jgi:SOS-response transcriptional repressor LexA